MKIDTIHFAVGTRCLMLVALFLASYHSALGGARTWGGLGADDNWSTTANWSGAIAATGSDLVFAGSTRLNNTNNVVTSVDKITFNNNAGAFVLGGAAGFTTITLAGDIDNNGTNTTLQTINLNLILNGNRKITLNSSSQLQINGDISESGTNRTLAVNGGGGDVGTLILKGNNSYSGATTLSNGVLNIQHANALGTATAGTTISSGAALQIQGDIVTAAEALAIDGTGIASNGALRNISGNNTYSGAITINSATRINSDLGLLTLNVASGNAITGSNDNLTFGGAGDITVADAISIGSGTLTKDLGGKLTLSAAAGNTYSGLTTISGGTLFANNVTGSATGTGAVSVTAGTLGGNGTITPTGANGISVSGVLAPGGAISTIETLTLNMGGTTGTVAMNIGASFEFQLGLPGGSIGAVGASDLLSIAGASASDFAFNNNSVNFLNSGALGYYKIFDTSIDNANTWTGLTFDSITGVVNSGLTYNNLASGLTGDFLVGTAGNGGTIGDIYFQVVPEPGAVLLGGLGTLLLLRRRRQA